jgi:hypothetical protein
VYPLKPLEPLRLLEPFADMIDYLQSEEPRSLEMQLAVIMTV